MIRLLKMLTFSIFYLYCRKLRLQSASKFGQCASAKVDTLVALQICSNGDELVKFCSVGFEDVDNNLQNYEFFKLTLNN